MRVIIKRSVYAVLIVAGIGVIIFMLSQHKRICVRGENVCFSYHSDWREVKSENDKTIRLSKSKPGAIFQVAVYDGKVSGDIETITTELDEQLKNKLSSYKLHRADQIAIDGIRSIEMTYSFSPSKNSRTVSQQLIVTSIGNRTYYFTTETAPADLKALQSEFDFMLSQVEIKR